MKIILKFVFLLRLFITAYGELSADESVTIVTEQGKIKGTVLLSDHGRPFYAFRGIRYATSQRFQEAKLSGPWQSDLVYDATKDGPACIQVDEMSAITKVLEITGSEDCLFLNIYRPRKSEFEKFPVMVFIQGGGYMSGSGSTALYGPQRFMDRDVTLVTFNYRLGPFGFLSTSDEAAPGNYGLLDQVLALRWVHDHISDFGGDPNSVTIFGESAGASSVGLQMLSPLSKGLFHGAIMQSGNALVDWGFEYRTPKLATLELAQTLNCPTTSTRTTIDCLKSKNAENIIKASSPLPGIKTKFEPLFKFRPTTDKSRGPKAFLPAHPRQLLVNGDISIVPTISGITKDEGVMFYLWPAFEHGGVGGINDTLPNWLTVGAPGLIHDPQRARRAIKIIEALYLHDADKKDLKKRTIAMNKIFSGIMDPPTDNTNELLAQRGCPVYPFKFNYVGKYSWLEAIESGINVPTGFTKDLKMVTHGDELQYFFQSVYFSNNTIEGEDRKMSELLLTLWTNFAKTKKPTLNADDSIKFRWSTFNANRPEYLDLDAKPKMVKGYLSEDRSLWNAIYQYHESFHETEN